MCLFGKPGAGHSQWEMWCSVFQGLRIDVNVQITLPSPAQVTGSELPDLLEEDEEDEYAKYIDPSPGPGSRDPSRASTPLDTDQAYDDASLRIPSPLGGQLLVYGSKPKPWSLIGRKGPRSESSSFIQAGEEDSETEESTGSFVVGDHEGSEDGGDQHTGERSTRPPRRSSRAESSTEPHDSGVGIESAVKRWSSVDEGVSTSLPASIGSDEIKIPDLGDLRDLTGQLDLEGRYPVASGGYGDVWKATLTMHSTDSVPPSVAVKVLRTRAGDPALQSKAQRRLNRELSIWRRLNHSNVLPLLGVAHDAFGGYGYAMVCPWLENGSISKWMEKCGDVLGMKERLTLICEVADGLSYLHSESIVHGDLSGSNILIDDAGHAVLCDFGLSILVAQLEFQTQDPSSVMGGGSVRWSDPLFFRLALQENNEDTPIPLFQANPATDIYSFGSVILEILSGRIPYHYIKTEAQVVIELHQGNKPRRPASTFVDDGQWNLIQSCWVDDHSIRPNIGVVSRLVRELCEAAQS
ncbi:kinase-like domain-containing protein [Flagelloscypha sp. PMI_526]|nr:kinase-like domain-containing protein [Flagelloscypha sp. PMI_526]